MKTEVRFAVAGCGLISHFHLQAIKNISAAKLCGVYDITPATAQKIAHEYQTECFTSYKELLRSSGADVVCICTPSFLHEPMALESITHGKHVLIEKPMALTLKGCDRLAKAAREMGTQIAVISQLRFSPQITWVKEALNRNILGKITRCDLYMKYYRPQSYYDLSSWRGTWAKDGGGALMNQGIHGIDLICYFMGRPKNIYAKMNTLVRTIEVEDTLSAVVEWPCNALGVIEASVGDYPGFPRRIEVNGQTGVLVLEENRIVRLELEGKNTPLPFEGDGVKEKPSSHNNPSAIDPTGHEAQIRNFIASLYGQGPHLVSEREGRNAVELVTAAYQSAREGRVVDLL